MKKYAKKIRHYKGYDAMFLRLLDEKLYSEEFRAVHPGWYWYHSGYFSVKRRGYNVTAWYEDGRGYWHF